MTVCRACAPTLGRLDLAPPTFAFSPGGKDLLGIYDRTLALWDLTSGQNTISRVFNGKLAKQGDDRPATVAYHPDGQTAISGTEAGRIVLWNVAKGSAIASIKAHELGPMVAFSRDGATVVSVAPDGTARTFAARSLAPIATYAADHDRPMPVLSAAAIDPAGSKAAMAGEGALAIRDLVSGKLSWPIEPGPAISSIALTTDAGYLAIGTRAGTMVVLSTATGSLLPLIGHTDEVTSLSFSRDGALLASASRDKTTRVWTVGSWKNIRVMAHPQAVNGVAWRSDGRTVATACDDGAVRLWSADAGDEVSVLPAGRCPALSVVFSPDGSMLLANTADGTLLRWRTDALARLPAVERPYTCFGERRSGSSSLAVAADGRPSHRRPAGMAWSSGARRRVHCKGA